MTTIAFIGFGEAAQSIAGGLAGRNVARLGAYDLRFKDPAVSSDLRSLAAERGVEPLEDIAGIASAAALRVGATCRICPEGGCPARREPSILAGI